MKAESLTIVNKKTKNKINHSFFSEMGPIQFWLLGFLAADGSVKKTGRISIYQSGQEGLDIITKIASLINHTNKIYKSETIGRDSFGIDFSSDIFLEVLAKYNIVNNKTHGYSLPDFKNIEDFRFFLLGYIDGDGSIGVYDNGKGSVYLKASFVGTKQFVSECVNKIPIDCSGLVSICDGRLLDSQWSGESALAFCDWLYSDIQNIPKHYKYNKYQNFISSNVSLVWSDFNKIKFLAGNELFDLKPQEFAKKYGINWRTVYSWRKEPQSIIKKIGNYFVRIK